MEKVHADKSHKEKAFIVLLTKSGSMEYEGNGLDEIKGRGNSSWYSHKKPYHLNLFSPASLLGMHSSRHWILLANASDRTNLRNKLVYDFAGKTTLPWSPKCQFVDLFINGKYNGLYLLSEQAEFDTGRINPADPEKWNSNNRILLAYYLHLFIPFYNKTPIVLPAHSSLHRHYGASALFAIEV